MDLGPWQKRVTALLAKLGEMACGGWVTVATPFLLELVKRRFPQFQGQSRHLCPD